MDNIINRMETLEKKIDNINRRVELNNSLLNNLIMAANRSADNSAEAVWGEIFNNTIFGSEWLINRQFSPGRWAVGYNYLYVLYRVLNEFRPQRILELGIGQTTRMIGQYAAKYEGVSHKVVEHDSKWIDFFLNDFELSSNTEVVQMELIYNNVNNSVDIYAYKDFVPKMNGEKFNLISIDAPFGSEPYSRIDVAKLLPGILGNPWCIMMDDTERIGEKNTIGLMRNILEENHIDYAIGQYSGQKQCVLMCSQENSFLTSM